MKLARLPSHGRDGARAALAAIVLGGTAMAAPVEHVSFNEEIQPILAENCFHCHGRDESNRKASLRLDERAVATQPAESGEKAIVPGKPDESEMIRRLTSTDRDEMMPPPRAHKTVSPAQIEMLKRWIAQGAEYTPHWSFVAPRRPALPETHGGDWGHNEIDRFVLAGLEKAGLSPNPEADKYSLIRRVTFDLTGLPPTPEEVSAYLADDSADAYERLVDRLLQSPRYGEHRTRYWLDAARYGDTSGLHRDNFRLSWPYRDYVIQSFNENKPFDRFTLEQIAGDLMAPDDFAPLVATGFNRLHITTSESGEVTEELQFRNTSDRVNTVSTLFLGLTAGCATCHSHKFDPISQKEYYALGAFFNNSLDAPFDDEEPTYFPTITLPPEEKREEAGKILKQRAAVEARLAARVGRTDLVDEWMATAKTTPAPTDGLVAHFRFDEGQGEAVHNSAPGAMPAEFSTAKMPPIWGELEKHWAGLRLAAASELRLGQIGDFERGDAFTVAGWFKPRVGRGTKRGTLVSKMSVSEKNRGWDLFWDDGAGPNMPKYQRWPEGLLTVDLIHEGSDAITVRAPRIISRMEWVHLAFSYDGSGKAAGLRLYINGEPQPVEVVRDKLSGSIQTTAPLQLGRRSDGGAKATDELPLIETSFQDLRIYGRRLDDGEVRRTMDEDFVHELLARPRESWSASERQAVVDFYFKNCDAEAMALRAEKARLDDELDKATAGGIKAYVMREHEALPMAHVLDRGVYTKRKERVFADVPAFLPPLPTGVRHDRLALARWMVSPENPLVSRVAVNRMWQELFGAGIVSTLGDFGVVGARPSNYALLDWLAVDFRESGWNVKRFYKQVVMSATYRQSAKVTAALLEKDPTNSLLARGPRFRLDGEAIRDGALAAADLLREKVGGPSVNIYQPPGMWEVLSMDGSNTRTHQQDKGDALYRRSLYTFWKRTSAPPVFATFDAPLRDVCTIQRERTDTPLQALVALNAPDFLEAGRNLAAHAMHEPHADAGKIIDFMVARLLTKPLSDADRAVLHKTFQAFQHDFTETEAREFLRVGDSPVDDSLPPIDLAAWSVVASQLLNTDQALNK